MTVYDVVLRGGQVVAEDGSLRRADVALAGGRIVAVAALPAGVVTREELDVTGHVVIPGLVDAHVHVDALLLDPGVQFALLRQGVTTVVLGQDGLSFAPGPAETLAYVEEYFGAVNGRSPWPAPSGWTVADLLARYDGAVPLNVGYLTPHGTIRHAVRGARPGPASEAELGGMERLLEGALADGALGLSTGLTYLPGTYSDVAELTRLCRVLTRHGAIHVSHMRGYDDQVEAGLAELVALADETGCRSHVSHLHGPASPMLDLVDDALRRGLEVTFDSYPYLRGSSILAAAALPTQLQENGPRETLARLADEDQVGWLRVNWFPAIRDTVLRRATVSHVGVAELRWVEGLSPWAAAEQVGADVGAFTCELLRRSRLDVGCVYGQASNTDDDVRAVLRHPMHMGGSDGIYLGARPHPRGWGTFARFLGRHTRALNDWHWGEAVRHLSTAPVRAFGLGDRGRVEPGAVADLAVIDPAVVADTATYERPRSPAIGVPIVLVAGQCVLRDGKLTGVVPGRALTRRASPRKGTG